VFANLKLSQQLMIGFGTQLSILAVISIIAIVYVRSGFTNFTEYRGLALETNLSGRIQANLLLSRIEVLKYLDSDLEKFDQEYQDRVTKTQSFLRDAKSKIVEAGRAQNIVEVETLLDNYKRAFERVKVLIANRHQIVSQDLDPAGLAMRTAMTSMMSNAADSNNISVLNAAARAQETLLLGRLYVVKFLVTNAQSDYERAMLELREVLPTRRAALADRVQNSEQRFSLEQFDEAYQLYVEAFANAHATITTRNGVIDNELNVLGPKIAVLLEDIKLSVKGEQDRLGPVVQSNAQTAVVTMVVLSAVSLIIGVVLSFVLARIISKPIGGEPRRIEAITNRISQGDLSQKLDFDGAYSGIFASMLTMNKKLKEFVGNITSASEELSKETLHVASISEQTSIATAEQKVEMEQIASAITQMSYSIQEVVKYASESADVAMSAEHKVREGSETVSVSVGNIERLAELLQSSVNVIQALEASSGRIGAVVEVIQNISEQTNLLALNAAIEAARAGEQGRGFAVVADEVRGLAQRTKDSTTEIQEIIGDLHSGTMEAVNVMKTSQVEAQESVAKARDINEAFNAIQTAILSLKDVNTQVASAVEEQSVVAEQISKSVNAASASAHQTSEGSKQTSQASRDIQVQADKLSGIIKFFKVA
jgi:methyl-accepting chemotaxis protein